MSASEWGDREAGLAAVGVIGGVALLLGLILAGILVYSFSWGYSIQLG